VSELHGPQEHGRDIVFYGPGGLRTTLYACVVKNDRMSGEAGSSQSMRTVIDQAKEAFSIPYQNPDNGQFVTGGPSLHFVTV